VIDLGCPDLAGVLPITDAPVDDAIEHAAQNVCRQLLRPVAPWGERGAGEAAGLGPDRSR
jgi:hypothetical protein